MPEIKTHHNAIAAQIFTCTGPTEAIREAEQASSAFTQPTLTVTA